MALGLRPVALAALFLHGFNAVFLSAAAPDTSKDLPMTKVVKLLQQMHDDLEKEAQADKDTYDSLKCWCDKNGGNKRQEVQEQQDQIDQLEADIEAASGKMGELGVEIERTERDLADGKQALEEAIEIRKKEAAAFHEQEKELIVSIELVKGAITALSKHHPAMLQANTELDGLRASLRTLVHRHLPLVGWLQESPSKEAFLGFLNANEDILEPDTPSPDSGRELPMLLQKSTRGSLRQMPVYKSYAPQSGQVMGVLKQLKDSFEEDLPAVQKEEAAKQEAFALFKGAKEAEIKQLEETLDSKKAQMAETKEGHWNAKNDLDDVKASLDADKRFLLELNEKCTAGDFEWERRQKMRTAEIQAVSEAIAILTTDEAKDGQQTTFGAKKKAATSFLQLATDSEGMSHMARRARALALLQKAAGEALDLSLLLRMAKADPFDKVIKAIDELIEKLKVQQADEVKHRDYCTNGFHENEVQTNRETARLESLEAQLEDLQAKHKKLNDEIATLQEEIHTLQVGLQRASEDRKTESIEFQRVVADQTRAIDALKAAHKKLSDFYFKHSTFLQESAPGETTTTTTIAPAPEFKAYQSHGLSNKVLNLIEKLTGEAQVIRDEVVHDEQNAQNAYQTLVAETNAGVKAKSKAVVDKQSEVAEVDQKMSQTQVEKDEAVEALDTLASTKAALHAQCDYLLRNFDARQKARAAEMDGLAEVKAILGGMK